MLFRHLGIVDAGRYVLVLSLVGIAQGLTESGLSAIGLRELAVRDGADRDRLMRALLGLRIVLTVLGVLGAASFALAAGYEGVLVLGTVVAGFGLVVQMLQSTLSVALMAELRVGWVAAVDLMRQLIAVSLIFMLVVLGASLLPLLAVGIPAAVVTLAVTAWLVRGGVPLRPSFVMAEWRALGREVLPYAVATAVNVLYFRVAIIVTSLIASPEEVGYFAASFRVIEVLVVVPGLLVSTAFPVFSRAARDDRARLAYAVQRTYEAAAALGGAAAVGLILGAPFVIAVVAGADFEPAIPVLRVQALALAVTFPAVTWGYALLSLRRHRELLIINLVALVLATVLTVILAGAEGARGAALATVAGEVALALAAFVALRRAGAGMGPGLGNLPRILIAAGLAATVALVPGIPAVVAAVAGTAIYLVAAWWLGAIPAELIVEARRLLRDRQRDAASARS